jgi:TonB family protein
MKTITLILLPLLVVSTSFAQTETKYYKDRSSQEEVPADKAKFSVTVTHNADGSVSTTKKDLKKNTVVYSETLKGEEPFGVWIYQRGTGPAEMNYNFELIYRTDKCFNDSIPAKTDNLLEDDPSLNYTAPKVNSGGAKEYYTFLAKNVVYPSKARRTGIQGKVYMTFTITSEGSIENIVVTKGVHISLDKEAVRVLRKLKFQNPPLISGKPQTICVQSSISFKLA